MSVPVITFFNSKDTIGQTSLVYHLAWMYADLGLRVIAADLDPQANLTSAFLDDDRLEQLWPDGNHPQTIFGCLQPLLEGTGDIAKPHVESANTTIQPTLFGDSIDESIGLLVGDLLLSSFEDDLSDTWPRCQDGDPRAFRVISAFWRIMQQAAIEHRASLILMDLGPNLGAINRAALIAADYVVVPLSPDLFSLQGLRNLGPTLRKWRRGWQQRLKTWQEMEQATTHLPLPSGAMQPIGYIVLQHAVRMDRPVQAYERWIARIPGEYSHYVLDIQGNPATTVSQDPHCLALLKHYRSLMPLAQEAHKPIFHLKPADGAMGSHMQSVHSADSDFKRLAQSIASRIQLPLPDQRL